MQMSLFDTVKLSELYSFVHECGMWQSEKCYKTVIEVIHSSLVVANLYTYGSTEEREMAHNAIVVDVLNGKGKIATLWKGEEVEINARVKTSSSVFTWEFGQFTCFSTKSIQLFLSSNE